MTGLGVNSRRCLTASGRDGTEGVVAVVKGIDSAPNGKESRVKVRLDGAHSEDSIYVPRKYAKHMKSEHKYEFHLEETTFRGGGVSRFSSAQMIRRTRYEPEEIHDSGFGGGSKGGGGFSSSR